MYLTTSTVSLSQDGMLLYCFSIELGACNIPGPCCTQDVYKVRGLNWRHGELPGYNT